MFMATMYMDEIQVLKVDRAPLSADPSQARHISPSTINSLRKFLSKVGDGILFRKTSKDDSTWIIRTGYVSSGGII